MLLTILAGWLLWRSRGLAQQRFQKFLEIPRNDALFYHETPSYHLARALPEVLAPMTSPL